MHRDLVHNQWLAGYQELMERIEPDDPRAAWQGDYAFATEPHTEDECPFKERDRLPFQAARTLHMND